MDSVLTHTNTQKKVHTCTQHIQAQGRRNRAMRSSHGADAAPMRSSQGIGTRRQEGPRSAYGHMCTQAHTGPGQEGRNSGQGAYRERTSLSPRSSKETGTRRQEGSTNRRDQRKINVTRNHRETEARRRNPRKHCAPTQA